MNITELSSDILQNVLNYVDYDQLCRISLTSKLWYEAPKFWSTVDRFVIRVPVGAVGYFAIFSRFVSSLRRRASTLHPTKLLKLHLVDSFNGQFDPLLMDPAFELVFQALSTWSNVETLIADVKDDHIVFVTACCAHLPRLQHLRLPSASLSQLRHIDACPSLRLRTLEILGHGMPYGIEREGIDFVGLSSLESLSVDITFLADPFSTTEEAFKKNLEQIKRLLPSHIPLQRIFFTARSKHQTNGKWNLLSLSLFCGADAALINQIIQVCPYSEDLDIDSPLFSVVSRSRSDDDASLALCMALVDRGCSVDRAFGTYTARENFNIRIHALAIACSAGLPRTFNFILSSLSPNSCVDQLLRTSIGGSLFSSLRPRCPQTSMEILQSAGLKVDLNEQDCTTCNPYLLSLLLRSDHEHFWVSSGVDPFVPFDSSLLDVCYLWNYDVTQHRNCDKSKAFSLLLDFWRLFPNRSQPSETLYSTLRQACRSRDAALLDLFSSLPKQTLIDLCLESSPLELLNDPHWTRICVPSNCSDAIVARIAREILMTHSNLSGNLETLIHRNPGMSIPCSILDSDLLISLYTHCDKMAQLVESFPHAFCPAWKPLISTLSKIPPHSKYEILNFWSDIANAIATEAHHLDCRPERFESPRWQIDIMRPRTFNNDYDSDSNVFGLVGWYDTTLAKIAPEEYCRSFYTAHLTGIPIDLDAAVSMAKYASSSTTSEVSKQMALQIVCTCVLPSDSLPETSESDQKFVRIDYNRLIDRFPATLDPCLVFSDTRRTLLHAHCQEHQLEQAIKILALASEKLSTGNLAHFVNAQDWMGRTALFWAVNSIYRSRSEEDEQIVLIQALLRAGADPAIKDLLGRSSKDLSPKLPLLQNKIHTSELLIRAENLWFD